MNKKPCKECPFRRESAPGYLGNSTGNPQGFLDSMEWNLLPCHLAVDWDNEDEDPELIALETPCIGSLQFCTNSAKFPRGAREQTIYQEHLNEAKTNPDVFKWNHEFIKHHTYESG